QCLTCVEAQVHGGASHLHRRLGAGLALFADQFVDEFGRVCGEVVGGCFEDRGAAFGRGGGPFGRGLVESIDGVADVDGVGVREGADQIGLVGGVAAFEDRAGGGRYPVAVDVVQS